MRTGRKYLYAIDYTFSEDYSSNGDRKSELFDNEDKFKFRLGELRNKREGFVSNIEIYYGEIFKGDI